MPRKSEADYMLYHITPKFSHDGIEYWGPKGTPQLPPKLKHDLECWLRDAVKKFEYHDKHTRYDLWKKAFYSIRSLMQWWYQTSKGEKISKPEAVARFRASGRKQLNEIERQKEDIAHGREKDVPRRPGVKEMHVG